MTRCRGARLRGTRRRLSSCRLGARRLGTRRLGTCRLRACSLGTRYRGGPCSGALRFGRLDLCGLRPRLGPRDCRGESLIRDLNSSNSDYRNITGWCNRRFEIYTTNLGCRTLMCGQRDWIRNWRLSQNFAFMFACVILTVQIAADSESNVSSSGTLPEFRTLNILIDALGTKAIAFQQALVLAVIVRRRRRKCVAPFGASGASCRHCSSDSLGGFVLLRVQYLRRDAGGEVAEKSEEVRGMHIG